MFLVLTILSIIELLAISSDAATETLYASKDTYIMENVPTMRNGSQTDMMAGHDRYQQVSGSWDTPAWISFVQFNLNSIPSGSTITGANLRLYADYICPRPGRTNVEIESGTVTSYWDENINYGEKPSYDDGTGDETYISNPGWSEWNDFQMVNIVQGWMNNPSSNYGFVLFNSSVYDDPEYVKFFTWEHSATYRPQLVVTYTAPPQTSVSNISINVSPIDLRINSTNVIGNGTITGKGDGSVKYKWHWTNNVGSSEGPEETVTMTNGSATVKDYSLPNDISGSCMVWLETTFPNVIKSSNKFYDVASVELVKYRISNPNGLQDSANPGTEKIFFNRGDTIRITLEAYNTGGSVPVTTVLNIRNPRKTTIYDSNNSNANNNWNSPLDNKKYEYYSFDWTIKSDSLYGDYYIGASIRDPNNFNGMVFDETSDGENNYLCGEDAWKYAFSVVPKPHGVTVLIHGFCLFGDGFFGEKNPINDYWKEDRIISILKAFGGGIVYTYQPNTGKLEQDPRPNFMNLFNPNGEIILVFNWMESSNDAEAGHAEAAADAFFATLVKESYIDCKNHCSNYKFHFIGHSRGASVVSEIIQRMGVYDIRDISYVTYLDPHDFDEEPISTDTTTYTNDPLIDEYFHDPAVQVWDNILYADNFWQVSIPGGVLQSKVPSGRSLEHLNQKNYLYNYFYNRELTNLDEFSVAGIDHNTHGKVVDWYFGTVAPGTQNSKWYNDHLGYDTGFSLWLSLGGYDFTNPDKRGISNLANDQTLPANPKTLEHIEPFKLVSADIYDDNEASTSFMMGDFDLKNIDSIRIAGWSYHGGLCGISNGCLGSQGFQENCMVLGPSHVSVRHNRMYIPNNVTHLSLKLRVNKSCAGDYFHVYFNDDYDWGYKVPLNTITDNFMDYNFNINPENLNKVGTITLEINNGTNVSSEIYIDNISFTNISTKTLNLNLSYGWNLISCPGVPVVSDIPTLTAGKQMFSFAYMYNSTTGAFEKTNTLEFGKSYLFGAFENLQLTMEYYSRNSLTRELKAGWNMVGSISSSVPTSSLTTTPSGQVFSFAYKLDPSTSTFSKAYTIEPGVGYLMGAFSDCTLTMNYSSPSPPSPQVASKAKPTWEGILSIYTQKEHRELVIGMHKQASDGVDISFDEPVPPLPDPMGSLSAGFVIEGSPFSLLSKSIVYEDSEASMSLTVELSESGELSWQAFPESYRCLLLYGGQSLDMHKESSLSLPAGKHNIRILLIEKKDLPKKTQLLANYPNPFNPETWMPFELSIDTKVEIMIYTSTGQLVRKLDLGNKLAGRYINRTESAYWDGKNEAGESVSSGVYFYTLRTNEFSQTRKMIIMR